MTNTTMQLLERLEALEQEIQALKAKNQELQALVSYYEEQNRLAQHRRFGPSSEKTASVEQLELPFFDEAEKIADKHKPEPQAEEVIASKRRKHEGKREEELAELPVERIGHTLPEEERICPVCGDALHTMGHDTRRELKVIPAQVVVVEHLREVYACRTCEKSGTEATIVKAPVPAPLISGSLASASAVAHIMVQKYVNAVPLYRQEQEFERNDIPLSRQTMANWLVRISAKHLSPLYEQMKECLQEEEVLHADETTVQVLREAGRKATTNSTMWLYRTSEATRRPIVLYEYQPTRSSAHPKNFLSNFHGYLHTDGYKGYHSLPSEITVAGCWAHMRRYFNDTLKAVNDKELNDSVAQVGLDYCNRLFELERDYDRFRPDPPNGRTEEFYERRYKERLQHSKPISEAFFRWARSVSALPKSLLGKAVGYALEQRQYLENVYLDGRLELSNNRAERSIKPFVIGRKNWLFSATPRGATASSVIYSILETAKENGLKLFEYMEYLLTELPNISGSQLDSLLPWSTDLPDFCRVEKSA